MMYIIVGIFGLAVCITLLVAFAVEFISNK